MDETREDEEKKGTRRTAILRTRRTRKRKHWKTDINTSRIKMGIRMRMMGSKADEQDEQTYDDLDGEECDMKLA